MQGIYTYIPETNNYYYYYMAKNGHNKARHCEFFPSIPSHPPRKVQILSSPSITETDEVSTTQRAQLHLSFPKHINLMQT
jgi:hypothetical protein